MPFWKTPKESYKQFNEKRNCSRVCAAKYSFFVREHTPRWKGGRIKTLTGYIYIHKPHHHNSTKQGYIAEHRYLMELFLGKSLSKKLTFIISMESKMIIELRI
jgi:hypothetical protein